jgi:methyltransferase-like protein/protein-L-isoaspartate O-methyltransferase
VTNPYDEIPYPALSYTPTHPDRLAIMARLMGLPPAPVEHCRVLELGCAVGGNLVPMAYALPGSRFVGIDNSARQVTEAQKTAAALGLENVAFRHLDILDVGRGPGKEDLGEFDYIIAHGIYSWVPAAVRSRILQICRENLARNGVAYVSYNTYPGWHMVRIVRDMLLYHTRHITDPLARASEARAVLNFFAQATPLAETEDREGAGRNLGYGSFLRLYAGIIGEKLDGSSGRHATLVLHDEMAEINEPVYFHQFVEEAQRHGLQYLGEADFSGMRGRLPSGSDVPPQVADGLRQLAGDLVELEQAVDFLRNRMFRRTLLCQKEVDLPPRIEPERIKGFYVTSRARPATAEPNFFSVSPVKFQSDDGPAITTDHPASKLALLYLARRWPAPITFGELLSAARAWWQSEARDEPGTPGTGDGTAQPAKELDAEVLAANLLTAYGYSNSLVDFHSYLPPLAPEVSERPIASAVARFQVQRGNQVTNLRHERVTLDSLDAFLLYHLDGSRDQAALLDLLMSGPVAQGVLTVQAGDQGLSGSEADEAAGEEEIRAILAGELARKLDWLACAALLVG